jgi:hypothetical protein
MVGKLNTIHVSQREGIYILGKPKILMISQEMDVYAIFPYWKM